MTKSPAPPRFTEKQGQYLAYIHLYRLLHGQAPAEADMERYFGVTPPSVHRMVVELERLRHDRIQPGHPEQNGRHERMHLTLKQEAIAAGVQANLAAQQHAFDAFRHTYNFERPHEALDQRPPAALYVPSPRPLPPELPPLDYPLAYLTRQVDGTGHIGWRNCNPYLGTAFAGHPVGLEAAADDTWIVRFSTVILATLKNHPPWRFTPPGEPHRRRRRRRR